MKRHVRWITTLAVAGAAALGGAAAAQAATANTQTNNTQPASACAALKAAETDVLSQAQQDLQSNPSNTAAAQDELQQADDMQSAAKSMGCSDPAAA